MINNTETELHTNINICIHVYITGFICNKDYMLIQLSIVYFNPAQREASLTTKTWKNISFQKRVRNWQMVYCFEVFVSFCDLGFKKTIHDLNRNLNFKGTSYCVIIVFLNIRNSRLRLNREKLKNRNNKIQRKNFRIFWVGE